MSKSNHVLLLDADYLVFSSMSAAEVETHWADNVWTLECNHEIAYRNLISAVDAIRRLRKSFETSDIVMCFTSKDNWRKDILPTYKMNRKATRKPTGYDSFIESLFSDSTFRTLVAPRLEGDDLLGILATNPALIGYKSATIVSPDKDFKTVPCDFYHMSAKKFYNNSVESANSYHMYQTLIGDITDGYTGIRGFGAAGAEDFLDEPYLCVEREKTFKTGARKGMTVTEWTKVKPEGATLWECMVSLAAKSGMTEDELLVQARVARILRYEDVTSFTINDDDSINCTFNLWTPSN